jgi:rSAM/selenodomain-associated transferase 2
MTISVIVPVLNEESALRPTLRRLRESGERPFEIVVVDGGSRDGTVREATGLADRVLQLPRAGRAYQMHQGALASSGELLVFLHADTLLPVGWQRALETAWNRKNPPAVAAFRLAFDRSGGFYWFLEYLAALRTRVTGVPLGDQGLVVRRDLYLAIGGYPDVPLMEEYRLVSRLRRKGRVELLPLTAVTSARRYEKKGRVVNALRNALITALYGLGAPEKFLARLYDQKGAG